MNKIGAKHMVNVNLGAETIALIDEVMEYRRYDSRSKLFRDLIVAAHKKMLKDKEASGKEDGAEEGG